MRTILDLVAFVFTLLVFSSRSAAVGVAPGCEVMASPTAIPSKPTKNTNSYFS